MPDEPIVPRRPIVVTSKRREPVMANPNPIADDGYIEARPTPRAPIVARRPVTRPPAERPRPSAVEALLEMLASLNEHLPQTSYADCGKLINALSKATSETALARRQKQEQLDAGTQRAPCATCGKMVDISKPGGYQIITERDEHYQPRNVYYCSPHCLLAKNMPSIREHQRKQQKETP